MGFLSAIKALSIAWSRKQARRVFPCKGCTHNCCTGRHNSMKMTRLEAEQIWAWLGPVQRKRFVEKARQVIADHRLDKDPGRHYRCPFLTEGSRCSLSAQVRPLACLSFYPDDNGDCYIPEGRHDRQFQALMDANRKKYGRAKILPIPLWLARMARRDA